MTRDEAIAVLHLDVPTTPNALKSAYRRRAFEEHPDHSKHPRAQDRFIDVQKAFAALENDPDVVRGVPVEARLDDGTPLSELGLGLGPTVNGKPCASCRGAGYRAYHARERCPDCRDVGLFGMRIAFRCRRCAGTGRFRRDGKDVGVCFACNGVGWHPQHDWAQTCQTCHGIRLVPTTKVLAYTRCKECEGCGETKMSNPVLPKGLFTAGLAAAQERTQKR